LYFSIVKTGILIHHRILVETVFSFFILTFMLVRFISICKNPAWCFQLFVIFFNRPWALSASCKINLNYECLTSYQARNQLGTTGGVKSYERGPNFAWVACPKRTVMHHIHHRYATWLCITSHSGPTFKPASSISNLVTCWTFHKFLEQSTFQVTNQTSLKLYKLNISHYMLITTIFHTKDYMFVYFRYVDCWLGC